MKKIGFCIAACAALSAGCADLPMNLAKGPNPANPRVTIVSGNNIVVNQEPIVVPKGAQNFSITWELPRFSSYTFPEDGIVIANGAEAFKCNLEAGRTRFTCTARNFITKRYKYTVKVKDGERALPPLDPSIMPDV